MKVKLAQGTTYVSKDGKTYASGDVLDLDQDAGEALIRTGSAEASTEEITDFKDREHGATRL